MLQRTIKKEIIISGIGLHSGCEVLLRLLPATNNTGIVFKRVDIKDSNKQLIPANYLIVRNTKLCTMLINDYGSSVGTVEHLMSALAFFKIDNVIIELNAPEVPVLDGSAIEFVKAIVKVGILELSAHKKYIKILKPINLITDKYSFKVLPAEKFIFNMEINFENAIIGESHYKYCIDETDYIGEVASARTFCFKEEIDYLQSVGLALGGTLNNAIVVDKDKVLNPSGLRYVDEFVRHKLLDAIGDLYMCGFEIKGEFFGFKVGHEANNLILREIFNDPTCYMIEDEIISYNKPFTITEKDIIY
jgi:UDP-3-O-[3-hydroxymyristoyl] N-acetylglucosamine deacetylase